MTAGERGVQGRPGGDGAPVSRTSWPWKGWSRIVQPGPPVPSPPGPTATRGPGIRPVHRHRGRRGREKGQERAVERGVSSRSVSLRPLLHHDPPLSRSASRVNSRPVARRSWQAWAPLSRPSAVASGRGTPREWPWDGANPQPGTATRRVPCASGPRSMGWGQFRRFKSGTALLRQIQPVGGSLRGPGGRRLHVPVRGAGYAPELGGPRGAGPRGRAGAGEGRARARGGRGRQRARATGRPSAAVRRLHRAPQCYAGAIP